MKARWVFNDLIPELPGVGMATVASWYPGKYWLVSTVQLDESSVKNYGPSRNYLCVEFIQPKCLFSEGIHGSSKGYEPRQAYVDVKIQVLIGKAVPHSGFVTQVYKCNRIWVYSFDCSTGIVEPTLYRFDLRHHLDRTCEIYAGELPLFEREYWRLSDARAGHKETVDLLAQGRLVMKS
jgi:hypothetical protein